MLHRVGGRVSGWRPQDTPLVRSCDSTIAGEVLFFILFVMFVGSSADNWSKVAVELRCWREEWRCAKRFGDCFLDVVLEVVDKLFFVSGVRDSCSKRIELQLQREADDPFRNCQGMARGCPCRTRAKRMRLPSSFVSCSLFFLKKKKQDLDTIVGRDSYPADHDAQGSCGGR